MHHVRADLLLLLEKVVRLVQGEGLRLQAREVEGGRAVGVARQQAVRLERVGPEPLFEPRHQARGECQRRFEGRGARDRDDVPQRQPVRPLALLHHVVADGDLYELGGDRRARAIGVRGPVAVQALRADECAARDAAQSARHGDPEGEVGLVDRVVVAREDGVRGVGLRAHREPVGGGDPGGVGQGAARVGAVLDTDRRPGVRRQRTGRRDPQLLVDLLVRGRAAGDADGADVQAEGVEGEAAEGLGGADAQGRLAVDQLGRGVVGEVEVVGGDAVAVVAQARVDGVTEGLGARGAGFFFLEADLDVPPDAAWAEGARVVAAAVPSRAAAGAVSLVRYLMGRFRSGARLVRSGRRSGVRVYPLDHKIGAVGCIDARTHREPSRLVSSSARTPVE